MATDSPPLSPPARSLSWSRSRSRSRLESVASGKALELTTPPRWQPSTVMVRMPPWWTEDGLT
ncbi:hypothetical protein ACWGI0_20625 [Streptomyces sp. NPDC054802]